MTIALAVGPLVLKFYMRRTVGGESVRKACLIGILLGFNCTWLVAPAVKIPLAAGVYRRAQPFNLRSLLTYRYLINYGL